jgi:hypothetical protein
LEEQSISYIVPKDGGTLIIRQEPVSSSMPQGAVPFSSNLTLLRLDLLAEGAGGTVQSITPTVRGAELAVSLGSVTLRAGQEQTLEVMVDTSASISGSLVSVSVSRDGVESDFADVSIVGEPAKAYVVAPPSSIVIDGAFGDWVGRITADTDSLPALNPDININATGAVNTTLASYFYVSVKGQMCNGSFVPTVKMKPTGGSGGGGLVIPTRITGEDLLRIFIDSDRNASTGVPMSLSSKLIGADYLLEIAGMDGVIDRSSLMTYQGGAWTRVPGATANAANDAQRIEIGVPSVAIGGSSSIEFIIETTDWRGRWDMATSIPQAYKGFSAGVMAAGFAGSQILSTSQDPWAVNSTGMTYTSGTGTTWTFAGVPSLPPGEYIVDMVMDLTESSAYVVTNSGSTYEWVLGTSTNWSIDLMNPINATANVVSMSFYSGSAAYILCSDGRYFWGKIGSIHNIGDWKMQPSKVAGGVTDFRDFVFSKTGNSVYAIRAAVNTPLSVSTNGGSSFTTLTNPTGSTSPQTHLVVIPSLTLDRLFVLCQNGNIRYSADSGVTWSALGNLPTPTGSNTSKYVGMAFDPGGYLWAITDSGWCYKSTDTTTFSNFMSMGHAPSVGGVKAIMCPVMIPEFPHIVVPIAFVLSLFVLVVGRTRRNRKA